MSGEWLDALRVVGALLFVGAAVKLMDDALDVEFDLCQGKRTLATHLGRAILPYSLVLFALAATLHLSAAIAAFFGSYAVGMFARPNERLPTRVPALVEIGVAALLSVLLIGWRDALWGLTMMSFVDWLDDVMDRRKDRASGQFNVALRFGVVEVLFAMLVMFSLALYADVIWTIAALIAWVILTILSEVTTTRLFRHDEEVDDVW